MNRCFAKTTKAQALPGETGPHSAWDAVNEAGRAWWRHNGAAGDLVAGSLDALLEHRDVLLPQSGAKRARAPETAAAPSGASERSRRKRTPSSRAKAQGDAESL